MPTGETKKGGEETPSPPNSGEVEKVSVAEVKDEIRDEISSLKKAIAEQKAKGEITGASESTLQVLYEELKAARADLAALKELGAKEVPVTELKDKFARWLPW